MAAIYSRWEAASNMKKYDDKYELTLTYLDGNTKSRRETTVIKSVGDFIDDNGVICQDIIEVKIKSLADILEEFIQHQHLILKKKTVINHDNI